MIKMFLLTITIEFFGGGGAGTITAEIPTLANCHQVGKAAMKLIIVEEPVSAVSYGCEEI